MKQLKSLLSEFAAAQIILMVCEFSIFPFEHCIVVTISGLELFMVLNSSESCILVEVRNAVNLVAFT